MERVTDDQFALIDGKLTHCPRGVDEYLELLEEDRRAQSNKTTSASKQGSAAQPQAQSGLSAAEVRELKAGTFHREQDEDSGKEARPGQRRIY